ncbi:MAG: EamA family transporter [Chloroflexota bacterium]
MGGKELALVSALCFGLNPVTLKLAFARHGRSDVAVVIGLAVAIPIYLLLLPFWGGLHIDQLTLPALGGFILGGLFGGGIGRRWMYTAIDKLGAAPATAIKNSAPVITTFLAVLLLNETVTWIQAAAIAGIVVGITLVTWKKGQGIKQLAAAGVLAAVGSAISYGIRPLFLEFGLDAANIPLTAALIGAVAAFIYATALTRLADLRGAIDVRSPALWLFVVSGSLQAVGFLAFMLALSANDVTVIYPVTSSAPLFTLGFTALLLRGQELVTWRIVLGVAFVVLGVIAL